MVDTITAAPPLKIEPSKKLQGPGASEPDSIKSDIRNVVEPLSGLKDNLRKARESSDVAAERIAQALEDYVRSMERDLKIQVNDTTGKVVVKVISREDGHVIREIPPEEWLKLAAKMKTMAGILMDKII